MYDIVLYEQVLIVGFEQVVGVFVGMFWQGYCSDFWEYFVFVDGLECVVVCIECVMCDLEIVMGVFVCVVQVVVVVLEFDFVLMCDEFCIWKCNLFGGIQQFVDMVGMGVGEQDGVDCGSVDVGQL